MPSESEPGRARLTGANAAPADVDKRWQQDNKAWRYWYVSPVTTNKLPGCDRTLEQYPPAPGSLIAKTDTMAWPAA